MRHRYYFLTIVLLLVLMGVCITVGERVGRQVERAKADAQFASLCAENVDLNQRLVQAELMIVSMKGGER